MTGFGISNTRCLVSAALLLTVNCTHKVVNDVLEMVKQEAATAYTAELP
jgi:hypothetical protein